MISVYSFLWQRLADYGQKYQSGADIVSYFNSKLAEVQSEIFNDFSPLYDESEKVKGLLDYWVKQQYGFSASDGTATIGTNPEVVYRPLSAGYTNSWNILFAIPSISESELIAVMRIPQRAPNLATKNVYYRFNSPGTISFYPVAITPFFVFYLIYPTDAHIAFTYSTTANEDIMTFDPTNSVDLAWPASAANLILYKMLEKYGVSVREEVLEEYAKYGIVQTAQSGEVRKK